MKRMSYWLLICAAILTAQSAHAQAGEIDVPSVELHADGDVQKTYFLIGDTADAPAKDAKRGLLIVLPGGDGSAEFNPFVKNIHANAMPEGFLIAQLVAVKWTPNQEIVWPTRKSKAPKMKFATEDFVSAVIDDVTAKHAIDPAKIFTLSWSSSGPAAYAVSLSDKRVSGSFVAMSVFKAKQLPALKQAKGRRYFLYHSPDDAMCPFHLAESAEKELSKHGGLVKLKTYDGGHGWQGDVFADLREGIDWLATEGDTNAAVDAKDAENPRDAPAGSE